MYLKVQRVNNSLFLSFVLAYSLRACEDLSVLALSEILKLEPGQSYSHTMTKTKKLIQNMAMRRVFNGNYSEFMKEMFPESLLPLFQFLEIYIITLEKGISTFISFKANS